jgi:hypothetical protein
MTMWTPDTPPVTREQAAAAVKAECDRPIDPTLCVSPADYDRLTASDPAGNSFEDMLADPDEQFDRRGELLRSVVEYANAEPAAAGDPRRRAARSWAVCPNDPPCSHLGLVHDIDEPGGREMCCVETCRCGAARI